INSQGTTVIVATHAQEMARRMGRRILYLDHGMKNEDLSVAGQSGEEAVLKSLAFEAEGGLFTEDGAVAEKGGEGDE
ncbi:MAG: hypothetical protein J6X19_05390, partial [Clostridia bacterium]|nr:hypothetical protein [Clostridia bacterium]